MLTWWVHSSIMSKLEVFTTVIFYYFIPVIMTALISDNFNHRMRIIILYSAGYSFTYVLANLYKFEYIP